MIIAFHGPCLSAVCSKCIVRKVCVFLRTSFHVHPSLFCVHGHSWENYFPCHFKKKKKKKNQGGRYEPEIKKIHLNFLDLRSCEALSLTSYGWMRLANILI